jgi:hypothetical protein
MRKAPLGNNNHAINNNAGNSNIPPGSASLATNVAVMYGSNSQAQISFKQTRMTKQATSVGSNGVSGNVTQPSF